MEKSFGREDQEVMYRSKRQDLYDTDDGWPFGYQTIILDASLAMELGG
jgi:hypothetical protein